MKRGICSCDSLLNILLCALGFIPGLIHAWYILAKYPEGYEAVPGDPDYEAAAGTHRVTYYYVAGGQAQGQNTPAIGTGAPDGGKAQRQVQRGPSYGAIGPSNGEGPVQQSAVTNSPPTYDEAIKGDNK